MDVYELPVSKSGGPRVDVDALMAELEAAQRELKRWRNYHPDDETLAVLKQQAGNLSSKAGTLVYVRALEHRVREAAATAGQLADAQRYALELTAQVNRLIDENKTVNDRLDAMLERMIAAEKSRDHWANEWTQMSAWAMDRDIRGDTYRARALALVVRVRMCRQSHRSNVGFAIDAQLERNAALDQRAAAEARLAAQQGAMETLRGLLVRWHEWYWEFQGVPGSLEAMLTATDAILACSAGVAAAEAQPAGEGATRRVKG